MPFVQFIRIFVLTALVNSSSLFDAHSIRKPPTSLSLTFSRRRRRRRHCRRRHLLQHGAAGHLSNMTLTALPTSLPPFCCCAAHALPPKAGTRCCCCARRSQPTRRALPICRCCRLCGSRTTRYRLWRRQQQQQHVIYSLCFCNSVFGLLFSASYALAERFCCFLLCLFFFVHLLGCFFSLIFFFSLLSSFYSPLCALTQPVLSSLALVGLTLVLSRIL